MGFQEALEKSKVSKKKFEQLVLMLPEDSIKDMKDNAQAEALLEGVLGNTSED